MQPLPVTSMALLLAHLLGDFPLQSRWISANKGTSFAALTLHGATHYILAWISLLFFTQANCFSISSQLVVLAYIVVHLLIDKLKCHLTARKLLVDDWKTFLLDQLLHLTVLAIAAILVTGSHIGEFIQGIALSMAAKTHMLEAAIVYIAVIFGGGYLIRYLTKGLTKGTPNGATEHLANAGLYIGWLERLLIVTAIVVQTPALVGLILTGKSIARFPEFKEARFVEYFLIGTFLSISLSVFGGIVLLQLLYGTVSLK